MNKIKVALFDFCKTLVKLNTLSEFVNFCLNSKNLHIPNKKFKKILIYLKPVLSRMKICSSRQLEIKILSGFTKNKLLELGKEFYNFVIKPNFNEVVINEFYKLKKEGYFTIIISAALDVYLQYIIYDLPFDKIICTELIFDEKGVCLGKVKGIDPVATGKVNKLKSTLDFFNDIDFEHSYFFTDDPVGDISLLKIVGNGFIVKNDDIKRFN
jgi:HAD superfamily hydrolase (TIGR01490 family)